MKKFIQAFVLLNFLCFIQANSQVIDVVGTGVLDSQSTTLYFSDIDNIEKIVVEAVFKADYLYDGQVKFSNFAEDKLVDASSDITNYNGFDGSIVPGSIVYFTTTFTEVDATGITLDQLSNVGGVHSFIAYVYRNIPDAGYYSEIDDEHVYIFRNCELPDPDGLAMGAYNYTFPIEPAAEPRDVNLSVVITEMDFGKRTCVIEVTDGYQTIDTTFNTPNLGASLNIMPLTLSNVSGDASTITVKIWSPCGTPYYSSEAGDSFITSGVVIDVEKSEDVTTYCTLTPGFYGTYSGLYCGETTTYDLLYDLLSEDMVLGGNGNTLTLTEDDADCIILRLPGWGFSKKLNGEASCSDPVGITVWNNRFRNTLLNQTIALGLNLRLDPNLGSLNLESRKFTTYKAEECGDPYSEPIPGTKKTFYLSKKVINYLGDENTVNDLFDLANAALSGQCIPGVKKYQIAYTINVINKAFKKCRVLGEFIIPNGGGGCAPVHPVNEFPTEDGIAYKSGSLANAASDLNDETSFNIYPNPVSDNATITFTPDYSSNTIIELYNIQGNLIDVLHNGVTEKGINYNIQLNAKNYPKGLYLLKITDKNSTLSRKISISK